MLLGVGGSKRVVAAFEGAIREPGFTQAAAVRQLFLFDASAGPDSSSVAAIMLHMPPTDSPTRTSCQQTAKANPDLIHTQMSRRSPDEQARGLDGQ